MREDGAAVVGVEGAEDAGDSGAAAEAVFVSVEEVKLRPIVLLCHSALLVASRFVTGKLGDVDPEAEGELAVAW